MRTRAKVAFLVLLTVGGILPISLILTAPSAHGMVRFSSYQDLERFLLTRSQCGPGYPLQYGRQVNPFGHPALGPALPASYNALGSAAQSSSSVSSAPSHSETNNQVAGVDELDTVKTDGQYIYTVSNNTVVIVSAYPVTNAQLVSRISIRNQTIDGIFLSGSRLAIVSEAPRIVYNMYGACGISTFVGASTRVAYPTSYYVPIRPQVQNTSISVYDLTNRSNPSLQTTVTINGTFIGARQTGTVPGHVLNQYSMDENQGYFRVATSSSGFSSSLETNVYVLDENLRTVGRLEGLSPGELFYAARFMGNRAYLVTYHNTDPLYVLDLHNPSSPTVMGSLIVAGYSDFLQPYDQTHLIGIGKVGVHTTVKVSLFNVTDPTNPVETATYTTSTWYSDSPALNDAKAVLFDKTNSLLVIPIDGSQYSYYQAASTNTSQCSNGSSAYVFNVTSTNLTLRGTVTHQTLDNPLSCSSEYNISRELFIGGVLYTISDAMIKLSSLTDLTQLGSVNLE